MKKDKLSIGDPLMVGNYEEFLITASERFKMESTMTRADRRALTRSTKPKRKYGYK